MASGSRVFYLDISHIKLVRDALKQSHFINANWFDLGVELNLPYPDLANIRAKWSNDPSQCLLECLSLWLTSANNRTWESLASALERTNQYTAATLIRNTYDDPASQIFQHYSNRISQVSLTDSCIQLLYTEGLITEDTQRKIKRCGGSLNDTLRELMIAVSDNHSKLRSLGNILMELEKAKPLAQDIIEDCDKIINNPVTTAVDRPVTSSTVHHFTPNATASSVGEFFFNAAHQSMFDEIRGNFIILIDELVPLICQSKASIEEMKSFLQKFHPELSAELSDADSIEGIMNIAVKKCRVNNISIVKAIVKRFKINRAKHLISEYEQEVKTVSGSLKDFLSQNQPEHFLICETIQFILGWEPEEHSLDDIRNLLEEAFKELNKRIIVQSIHRGNSIIIICYSPHHLLAALLFEAQDKLTVLKEFNLIKLTIGHYTVYDKRIRYKVMNEHLAEDIKLADEEEQELRTLLDCKEGSILEQNKELNIIKKRKESKLKVKLLTRGKLINKIFKSKKSETQYFRTSLLMKAGREEALAEYKKAIELLQENISITRVQLLMSQKANTHKKDQCTQSPTAKTIYTAHYDYHGIYDNDLSFSEEEQLEIYEKTESILWWKGRSLVTGDEGYIPSSYVYSMLESLQLLEFILSLEEVSLPILQKIRNDSSHNDEKASLFLETINDDPIMISALRQDKWQHDIGLTGGVDWDSDSVFLHSPSPVQCNEVISNIKDHKEIKLDSSSTNSTVSLLSSTKLLSLNLRRLVIWWAPLTNDCIQYLCILLTNNKTIQELDISRYSISDRGVTSICQALKHNSTLTLIDLSYNPLIISSGEALSHILINNLTLVELDLRKTSLSTESVILLFQSLVDNKYVTKLRLDYRHKETCITYPIYHLIQDRVDWY
uniref:SH3 domain-containing protein n=1 Tax=Amphimedon queenslandica TaxID=400682 RepID=A0A1X7UDR3_AMPQE